MRRKYRVEFKTWKRSSGSMRCHFNFKRGKEGDEGLEPLLDAFSNDGLGDGAALVAKVGGGLGGGGISITCGLRQLGGGECDIGYDEKFIFL